MFLCLSIFKKKNKIVDIVLSPTPIVSPSLTPENVIINMWSDLKPIDPVEIKKYPFPENKYFHDEYEKTQIVLHHTVSGRNIDGDVSTWANGKYNVGVTIIIDRNGVPWELFPSKYWAYHLGTGDHSLDKHSIAIEIDNWGGFVLGDGTTKKFGDKVIQTVPGKYYAYYGNAVDNLILQEYPEGYRGYKYFEKYTIEQIRTVGKLLLYWREKYNIPLYYNPSMINFSQEAINGKQGVWLHTSYRKDKSDIHPQPEIMEMLKTICTDEMPVSLRLKRKWFKLGRKKGHDVENTKKFIW